MQKSPWLSMTLPELNELEKYNGGMPIKDAETQNRLHDLRNDAQLATFPQYTQVGSALGPAWVSGTESYMRRASVPNSTIWQSHINPTDEELLLARQKSILDGEKFQNQLDALGLGNAK